jgi:hypothetical protein
LLEGAFDRLKVHAYWISEISMLERLIAAPSACRCHTSE